MATESQDMAASKIVSRPLETSIGSWARRWWQLMEIRIGIIPLTVYFLLLGLLVAFVLLKKVTDAKAPEEISMVIAIMVVGGFTCAEIGKRLGKQALAEVRGSEMGAKPPQTGNPHLTSQGRIAEQSLHALEQFSGIRVIDDVTADAMLNYFLCSALRCDAGLSGAHRF